MTPDKAYLLALTNGFTEKLQEIACRDSNIAYHFARKVAGADIEKCQTVACKHPIYALWFAQEIRGADIDYCKSRMGIYLDQYLEVQMIESLK